MEIFFIKFHNYSAIKWKLNVETMLTIYLGPSATLGRLTTPQGAVNQKRKKLSYIASWGKRHSDKKGNDRYLYILQHYHEYLAKI